MSFPIEGGEIDFILIYSKNNCECYKPSTIIIKDNIDFILMVHLRTFTDVTIDTVTNRAP